MPHGTEVRGRSGRGLWCLVLGLVLSATSSLAAQDLSFDQELSLKRDYPGSGTFACPAVTIPDPPLDSERLQATQLASSADQALILGDLERAATLMARATELDPSSADLAYRHGRVLQESGDRLGAIDAYCRVLAGEATEDLVTDAEARIQALADARWAGISDEAAEAFQLGLSAADADRFAEAAESFGVALVEAPEWADAAFNRALMLDRLGRGEAALAGLRRYLELRPDAPDAVAVSARIGQLEGASAAAPSPPSAGTALALGLIVPGGGQFYSDRAVGGSLVLSLAGGAIAAGLLVEEVEVECLVPVGSGEACPAGQVFRETSERPYLGAALGVAAGVALIGAIEAYVKARGGEDESGPFTPGDAPSDAPGTVSSGALASDPGPGEVRLAWPSVSQRGVRVDLNVLRLTF